MTVTYPHDRSATRDLSSDTVREEPFIPVYARTGRSARGRKGGLKTWMIMAPIGVVFLGVGAAAMMMGGGEEAAPAPLAEPAAVAPVLPVQSLPAEMLATPVIETPAPVVRSTPAPAPARVARRAAPAPAARAAPATPAPVAAAPQGPQPYTTSLNTTAAPALTTAPPPVVVIEPAD